MYALSNLIDKQPPSSRAIKNSSDALNGEIVVEDLPPSPVWDASLKAVRSLTDTEIQAQRAAEAARRQNENFIRQEMDKSLADLQAIADTFSSGAAANSQVFRALHILARNQKRMIRLVLRELDTAD